MTQEYKSIREWIAEGVKLSDLLGYVDENGNSISQILVTKEGMRVTLCRDGSIKIVRDGHPVATPKPKRLSDEELLRDLLNAARKVGMNEAAGIRISQDTDRQYTLRDAVLDRMKAKGPTRGEVEKRFSSVFWSYEGSRLFREHRAEFLSMFPEGEE